MRKYTDEQLSRILGEHDAGQLSQSALEGWGVSYLTDDVAGCIEQVANNEPSPAMAGDWDPIECICRNDRARWFDDWYIKDSSVDLFLAHLERDGLA